MTTYLVSFLLAFSACLLLTPLVIRAARRWGVVDAAGHSHRKIHAQDIPRLGGLAIAAAFYVPIVGLTIYGTKVGDALLQDPALAQGLLAGGLVIAALGLYDDLRGASPRLKLVVQCGVALWMGWEGFLIERVDLPFLPQVALGWASWPVTVLWIVGVTNAVNLLDGLDGLAAGVALFGLAPMVVLAIAKGNLVLALISSCLAGSLLGFLVYNFHPARIFMGDTGSMFLGFVMAVVTVATASKGRAAVAMLTPVLVLGLPILDTLLAIARRAWLGQSLFAGDKQHIHHRLMASGLSHPATVLVMYGLAALFALLGLGVHFNRDGESALLFLLSLVVAGVLLRKLGYFAMSEGASGGHRAIRERNQLLRAAVGDLAPWLDARASVEAVASGAALVARGAGAWRAVLVLDRSHPAVAEHPVERTWTWDLSGGARLDAAGPHHSFALVHPQGAPPMGRLDLTWADDGSFHESVLPGVERGCRVLAERLTREVTPDASGDRSAEAR